MSVLHENIKNRRIDIGMSQQELADLTGYTDRSSIAKIEAGKVDLTQTKILKIANALNTSASILMGWGKEPDNFSCGNVLPLPKTKKVPRLGTIACGEPILAEQNIEDYDSVPDYVKADFTLVCKGDSMINARIFNGDIVCIHQQDSVENGDIAAVLIDDEATLKRVRLFDDHISLEPENPMYKPLVYWGNEMSNVRILGKATHFISCVR